MFGKSLAILATRCSGALPGILVSAVTALAVAAPASAQEAGETKALKWKDGKQAAFLLAFDDSCPTHLTNVIPELTKRGIVGNFYVVPGKGTYPPKKAEWEKAALNPVVRFANHTFTHGGATSVAQLDEELKKANEVLLAVEPERKQPRLIGFGRPGGVPWTVTKEEQAASLAKFNLIDRPPFWGPPIHQKSAADLVATVDKAIAKNEMGHADFHGVGGDWLVTPVDWFTALLDKLEAEKERVWVTDVVSWHQYEAERNGTRITVAQADSKEIRLALASELDPALYDLPLTLETNVPADWKAVAFKQGGKLVRNLKVADGVVRYDAVPGEGEIALRPEK